MRAKARAPQRYTWTLPICPHDVTIDLAVVRALADELSATTGPLQGLLLGARKAGLTRIDAVAPLPVLDAVAFAARIAAEGRPVVGYYRIRQGCAFIFDPTEIALARGLFREPGSVVLLAERRESGGAEGTFAFWRGEAFVSNLPRPFPLDAAALVALPPPDPPEWASGEFLLSILRRNAGTIGLFAAAVAGIAILPLIWSISGPPVERGPRVLPLAPAAPRPAAPPPAISSVSRTPRDIEITWDSRNLSTATSGLLKILDGDLRHHVSLDLDQLRFGSIVYTPGPGPVSAQLKVLLADGGIVEIPVSDRLAPLPEPPPRALPAPLAVPTRMAAVERPGRSPVPSPTPTAFPGRKAKRFEFASPVGRDHPGSAPTLPDAPAVQMASPAVPLLAVSLPALSPPPSRVRLGPPVERSAPAGSGRLIWTGTLERRGVVEFEGRSVSVGSLTGSLPGVPVNFTVLPAEFANGGLVVYTNDARLNLHVEPPSAANGWNRITYIWDPERVRQIAVLETPNPSNRFSHLALRSDARRVSMLVIDWKAQSSVTR
jgi:hypothetical protein